NNDIVVKVPVTKTGGPQVEATVSIKRGRDTIAAEKVTFAPGDGDKVISVKMTPHEAGNFVYTATVASEGAVETVLVNNSAYFPLQVDKEKIQVVYVEGFLRFEFKFLKKHLEDDPDVLLTPLVRVDNPEHKQLKRDQLTPELLKNK